MAGEFFPRVVSSAASATVLNQASAAVTANGDSGPLDVSAFQSVALDVNVSAITGTSASLTLYVDRLGADGAWYNLYASAALAAIGSLSTSIGAGMATAQNIGGKIRLRWVVAGTTPSVTFSASIIGK